MGTACHAIQETTFDYKTKQIIFNHERDIGALPLILNESETDSSQDRSSPSVPVFRRLEDRGIGVALYHPEFLALEVAEVVTDEIASLTGTFLLMVFFLACSIGMFSVKRWLLSLLVVLQPALALLLAGGIGSLPIWTWVPGDLDENNQNDNVLPLTLLTTLGLHLYLAVIVDYDIILVRA